MTTTTAWAYLAIAGLFEIGWVVGVKYTDGFTQPWPSVLTAASMAASVVLLSLALRAIPVGTAYAVWTGIGATGTALYGIAALGESTAWPRLACLTLIVLGIVGLKLTAA